MTTAITSFAFGDNLVRIVTDEKSEPWFVAKDVCRVLELGNVTEATRNLDADERCSEILNTPGGTQEMLIISEPGLYSLIFRSRKPEAKRFSKWVRAEVLPTLRKTGRYTMPTATRLGALPEIVQRIKPAVRERILTTAQRVVSMSGSGSKEEVEELFVRYCALVTDGYHPTDPQSLVAEHHEYLHHFVKEQLEPSAHGRLTSGQIISAAKVWWKDHGKGDMPTTKTIGTVVSKFYSNKRRSNGVVYHGVQFRETPEATRG